MLPTTPIFDGHNDALLALAFPEPGKNRHFFEHSPHGHLDLPRARAGGMFGGLYALFVSPLPTDEPESARRSATPAGYAWKMSPALDPLHAQRQTDIMLDLLTTIERDSAGSVRITRTVQEIEACLAAGVHSATIHFEGAEAIHADLSNLADYHDRGLRSLGITWSRPNAFGHGVPFQFPGSPDTGPGLTDAGKALVPACGQLKILLDVSHLNQQGFFDVMNLAAGPVVASHSNAHALCPSPRNLTDDQLGAIAATGGLVGITPAVLFLRDDGRNEADTPLSRVVDHVRYVADLIGIEHVGLGSDFDGARVPAELGDASGLTRLIEALRDGGLSDSDIDAIAHQNWLRVLRQTWGR